MMEDIPYFKIRFAMMSTWTLREAAHLLLHHDPDAGLFEIDPIATNPVSNLFYYLVSLSNGDGLKPVIHAQPFGKNKRPSRYNADQFAALEETVGVRQCFNIFQVRAALLGAKRGNLEGTVRKAIYQRAAALIWEQDMTLYANEVAKHLEQLPAMFATKCQLELQTLQAHRIKEYLKGMSPHGKGAPKKGEKRDIAINLSYVIERMI